MLYATIGWKMKTLYRRTRNYQAHSLLLCRLGKSEMVKTEPGLRNGLGCRCANFWGPYFNCINLLYFIFNNYLIIVDQLTQKTFRKKKNLILPTYIYRL